MKKDSFKALYALSLVLIGLILDLYISYWIHKTLSKSEVQFEISSWRDSLNSMIHNDAHRAVFLVLLVAWILIIALLYVTAVVPYYSRTRFLAAGIRTPVASGQGQHGTARFADEKSFKKLFSWLDITTKSRLINELVHEGQKDRRSIIRPVLMPEKRVIKGPETIQEDFSLSAGVVLGMQRMGQRERLFCVSDDVHTLCIGSTRSGKTRSVVLQSIGVLGLAGESMILSDPKGELYQYTSPYLERLGYQVITIDYRNPANSHRYNYLQVIMDAVDAGDITKAIDATWDLTATLVGQPKGERIWTDGEASAIACAILAVVYDNRPRPCINQPDELQAMISEQNDERAQYRNLGNVYAFLANMCVPSGNSLPLASYMADLPEGHPAKSLAAISRVAPQRTQGSFYTAALTTLRLFTNPSIHRMTSSSDFKLNDIGKNKTALFVILPDEKSTYYSLASLFVSQCYEQLVKCADARGGRLERRTNFILDEFGNFTHIPDFANKLTVGGGRGIRFTLFLQSIAQLKDKYGEDVARIIRGNCENWIYLQAEDMETLKEISDRLGNYTVSTFSVSGSHEGRNKSSSSHNMQLTGRPLLTPDEVGRVRRPYNLVLSRKSPALMFAPDISEMFFNDMFGMGDKEHNRRLRETREHFRSIRESGGDLMFWNIWRYYSISNGSGV